MRDLTRRSDMPVPRLHLSPTSAPDAFATGRNPGHAAVCVTGGILGVLTERELRGVLDDGPGILEILLLALLGPLVAGLVRAAVSRSREFAADASGAEVTGDPEAGGSRPTPTPPSASPA